MIGKPECSTAQTAFLIFIGVLAVSGSMFLGGLYLSGWHDTVLNDAAIFTAWLDVLILVFGGISTIKLLAMLKPFMSKKQWAMSVANWLLLWVPITFCYVGWLVGPNVAAAAALFAKISPVVSSLEFNFATLASFYAAVCQFVILIQIFSAQCATS